MIPHGLPAIDAVLVLVVLLGLHYRSKLSPLLRNLWYAVLVVIIAVHGLLLGHGMWTNVQTLREGDFLGFWINAHVAGAGHNFYDPAYGQALAKPFVVSDEFRREILDVGFWYPPPSIFTFLPLTAFANPYHAMIFWFGLQTIALLAAFVVLGRTFLRAEGVLGVAVVAALILMLPATASTVQYSQTTFMALLFTALFWNARRSATGGVMLVLATCVKPFVGALSLVLFCRKRMRALTGAGLAAVVVSVATLVVFGSNTFMTFFRARTDARIPALVYSEDSNESLLGLILRATHGVSGDHVSHLSVLIFSLVAFVLTAITLWLCLRREETDDQILLSLMLSLSLLIYPPAQVFYSLLLVIPALVLWCRRSARTPAWLVAAGLCVAYAFTTRYPVVATLLSWLTFALLAAPKSVRAPIVRLAFKAPILLSKVTVSEKPAYPTALGLTILGGAILTSVALQHVVRPQHSFFASSGTDFRAFYCAGVANDEKASPYRVEPLRSCEHRVQPALGWADELVVPAPLPGYDIAFFSMLARLPYEPAKALWFGALVSSVLASAFFLARLTRLPAILILLGLSLTDGYQSIVYGQLPPLVVAALCAAAYFLQHRRYIPAAVAAGISMIEPHLGLPACLAMFVWFGRTRLPLAGFAVVLIAAGFSAFGVAGNIDYLTHVLPQHAAAELVATDQYGLPHELHVIGFSDRLALALGSASYILMSVIGLYLGRRVATIFSSDGLAILVPPAAALLGGTFIHGTQFAAALPAAFLLFSCAEQSTSRRYASFALALLVVPWDIVVPSGARGVPVIALSLITLVWIVSIAIGKAPLRRRLFAAAGAVAAFTAVLALIRLLPGSYGTIVDTPKLPPRVTVATAAASENWGAYLKSESNLSVSSLRNEVAKVPYWLAILLLITTAFTGRKSTFENARSSSNEISLSSAHGY